MVKFRTQVTNGVEMNIYASVDDLNIHNVCRRTDHSDNTRNQTSQHTGSENVRMRSYRSVTVCLVLLCVLLLTAVIVMLCVLINTNNQQFHIKSKNLTEERDQLLTKYTNLTNGREPILLRLKNLATENDKLLTNNNNLNKQREQLTQQKNTMMEILKADGWKEYQSSLYFISSEKKTWSESRRYCRERGTDLTIINNKEEQDFIRTISSTEYIWIGLSDSDVEGRWKWVDGSTLNYSFWRPGDPNGYRRENCVLSYSSWWHDFSCNKAQKWICERKF